MGCSVLLKGLVHTPLYQVRTVYRPPSIRGTSGDVVFCDAQILYPHPPAAVWATAKPAARAAFEALPLSRMTEDERDARLEMVIEAVELDYLLGRSRPLHSLCCSADPDASASGWTGLESAFPLSSNQLHEDRSGALRAQTCDRGMLSSVPFAGSACRSAGLVHARADALSSWLLTPCSGCVAPAAGARGGSRCRCGARR